MFEVVVGLIAIALGALLAFRGYPAMRVVVSLLGSFVGFMLGAAIGAALAGTAPGASVAGWMGGIIGAILLGLLAFKIYRFAIIVGIGAIGFTIGVSLATLAQITNGAAVIAIGFGVSVLLVIVAFATDLPSLLIIIMTAVSGADLLTVGVRMLLGDAAVGTTGSTEILWVDTSTLWWVLTLGVAIAGIAVQWRYVKRGRRASMRDQWNSVPPPTQSSRV